MSEKMVKAERAHPTAFVDAISASFLYRPQSPDPGTVFIVDESEIDVEAFQRELARAAPGCVIPVPHWTIPGSLLVTTRDRPPPRLDSADATD